MSEKLLSIIVPSYNMEKYLHKCLSSLIVEPEKMDKIDVIVVNDGSTDRTSGIAHEFADKYPGVFRVIDKTNGHYGSCINAALPDVRGEYLKILDADDYFDATILSKYLDFLDANHGLDLVTTNFSYVDSAGVEKPEPKCPYPLGRIFTMKDMVETGFELLQVHTTYRSSIFKEFKYKQTEGIVYTDTEFMFEPMLHVRRVKLFDESLYRYLIGRAGQSVDRTVVVQNVKAQIVVLRHMLAVYEKQRNNVAHEYCEYMHIYLRRIFKFILNVYFNHGTVNDLNTEFRELYDLARSKCEKLNLQEEYFGIILFGSKRFIRVNLTKKWDSAKNNILKWFWPLINHVRLRAIQIFVTKNTRGTYNA